MTPLVVTWLDAHADRSGGWVPVADIDNEAYIVRSIGWLIDPPPKTGHVSLAQSYGDDGMVDSVVHIPQGMIRHNTKP